MSRTLRLTDYLSSSEAVRPPALPEVPSIVPDPFFREHQGQTFELVQLEQATGWKPTSIKTYIAKKWQLGCTPFMRQKVKTLPQPVEESSCLRQSHY